MFLQLTEQLLLQKEYVRPCSSCVTQTHTAHIMAVFYSGLKLPASLFGQYAGNMWGRNISIITPPVRRSLSSARRYLPLPTCLHPPHPPPSPPPPPRRSRSDFYCFISMLHMLRCTPTLREPPNPNKVWQISA